MGIDIRQLLIKGRETLGKQHETESQANPNYRVGSSGAVCKDNQIRGVCPRIAMLRQMKIEEKPSLGTRVMWGAGVALEDDWAKVLTASGAKFDMQRDIVWEIAEGITVTGHPDVIIEQDGQEYGLELKGCFSYNTAAMVYLEHRPKSENIVQALCYGLATGLPWYLVYTSPSFWKVPFYDKKKTDLKSLPPFYQIFTLEWRGDTAWYKHEEETEWVETLVTKQGIEDYYRLLHEMQQKKVLGPRPTAEYVNGDTPQFGNDACFFCPLKEACDALDLGMADFDVWLNMVKGRLSET